MAGAVRPVRSSRVVKRPSQTATTPPAEKSRYVPEIDGLRALAFIGVLFCHLRVPGCELGYIGVPVFFTISGFLITRNLLDARGKPGYFREFYGRRALRILPIYFLVLAATLAIAWIGRIPMSDWPYYVCFWQNHTLAANSLTTPKFPILLAHTWSLAVEEQFYLLWPMAIAFLPPRRLGSACVTLFLVAPIVRLGLIACGANWHYTGMLLPTSLDSLAAGAIAQLAVRKVLESDARAAQVRSVSRGMLGASLVAAVVMGMASAGNAHHMPHWLFFSVLGVAAGALLVQFQVARLEGAALLRHPVLTHLGKISYGLYLYHYPAYIMLWRLLKSWQIDSIVAGGIVCLTTYLVALASWMLIERPCLRLKPFVGHRLGVEKRVLVVTQPVSTPGASRRMQGSNWRISR